MFLFSKQLLWGVLKIALQKLDLHLCVVFLSFFFFFYPRFIRESPHGFSDICSTYDLRFSQILQRSGGNRAVTGCNYLRINGIRASCCREGITAVCRMLIFLPRFVIARRKILLEIDF